MKTGLNSIVRTSIGLISVFASFLFSMQRICSGVEPGDFPEAAIEIGNGGQGSFSEFLGDGINGVLDVDFYKLPSHWGLRLFVADVSQTQSDLFLRLFGETYDGRFVELARNDDRELNNPNPLLRTYLLGSDAYAAFYVGVSSASNPNYDPLTPSGRRPGKTGPYTITFSIQQLFLPLSAFEPNDETPTDMGNGSFQLAGEFIGDFNERRDVDTYKISLLQPARLDVVAAVDEIDSPLDPVVQVSTLFTGGGMAKLGVSDHNSYGTRDAILSLGIPQSGDVVISVYGNGNAGIRDIAGDRGDVGSVGPYNLIVNVTSVDASGQFEPNDSLTLATPSSQSGLDFPRVAGHPNEVTISGYLGDGPYQLTHGDRDFYQIKVRKSGIVTVRPVDSTNAISTLDPVLAMYDPLGSRVQSSFGQAGTWPSIAIPLTCGESNTYSQSTAYLAGTLMIMGNGQRFPNDPYIPMYDSYPEHPEQFATGDGPGSVGTYAFAVSWRDANDACGSEPNDTISMAIDTGLADSGVYLCTNSFMGDSMCGDPGLDVDFWQFRVTQPLVDLHIDVAGCRVTGEPYPLGEALIRVIDDEGNEVKDIGSGFAFGHLVLDLSLTRPGKYYVGVSDWIEQYNYDPNVPCSTNEFYDKGKYDILIRLSPANPSRAPNDVAIEHFNLGLGGGSTQSLDIFASRSALGIGTIEDHDTTIGNVISEFDAPEITFGGAEGLAIDGSNLFFMGSGWYPRIYQLDANSGEVQSDFILSYGSGFYSDAAMLGGELFVLDYREGSIHALDPITRQLHRTLPIASRYGIPIGGGLASASYPNRLYVADAFGTGDIYEIEPQSGALVRTFAPLSHRPIALAGINNSELWSADWLTNSISILDRSGSENSTLTLENEVTSLSSTASPNSASDMTNDGNVDLRDLAVMQNCFSGLSPIRPECSSSDADDSGHVDLKDFAGLNRMWSGP